jgi:hypothetical protein
LEPAAARGPSSSLQTAPPLPARPPLAPVPTPWPPCLPPPPSLPVQPTLLRPPRLPPRRRPAPPRPPKVGRENPAELKAAKLARSLARGLVDRDQKPNSDERRAIAAVLRLPPNRPLAGEERALLWRYRWPGVGAWGRLSASAPQAHGLGREGAGRLALRVLATGCRGAWLVVWWQGRFPARQAPARSPAHPLRRRTRARPRPPPL